MRHYFSMAFYAFFVSLRILDLRRFFWILHDPRQAREKDNRSGEPNGRHQILADRF